MKDYKYTMYGALVGVAVSFIYAKTWGKNKSLTNLLLIGGGTGIGLGLIADLSSRSKNKFVNLDTTPQSGITESSLRLLAKSLGIDTELKVNSYILLLNQVPHTPEQRQNVFKVINAMLKAIKDNKWDENASAMDKKDIILSYGVSESEFSSFQQLILGNIGSLLGNLIK